MKDPTDPVGPAFDAARDRDAEERAQRIVALTPDQRRDYERRIQQENKQIEVEQRKLDESKEMRIEQDTKRRLNQPMLLPPDAKRMSEGQAREAAKKTVNDQDKAAINRANAASQERLDSYLRQTERDRHQQEQHKEQAAQQARHEFNDKARDPALGRAFARAKDQQDRNERDRSQSRQTAAKGDSAKDHSRSKAHDPSLRRAFEQAKQREETKRNERGRDR